LIDVLFDQKIYVNSICGGHGTCGNCKIQVKAGRLLLASSDSKTKKYVTAGEEAMACRSLLIENCVVDIGQLREKAFVGVSDFEISTTDPIDAGLEIVRFVLETKCLKDGISLTESVNTRLGRFLIYRQKALQQLSVWFTMVHRFIATGCCFAGN
jgi:Na+-transporting NADH:ubiquinone oxidoreductase subunit NqrF